MASATAVFVLWNGLAHTRRLVERRNSCVAMSSRMHHCSSTRAISSSSKRFRRKEDRAGTRKNPFERSELRERLGGHRLRNLGRLRQSLSTNAEEELQKASWLYLSEEENRKESWQTVYRFQNIHRYAFVSRLKIYQTIVNLTYVPYVFYLFVNEEATSDFLAKIVASSVFATLMLFVFSRTFNRMIGVIAVNKNRSIVRIGHLSFWGRRKNRFAYVDDLVPLSQSSDGPYGALMKLSIYDDSKNYLLLSTKNAQILNDELSELIFGSNVYFDEHRKRRTSESSSEVGPESVKPELREEVEK